MAYTGRGKLGHTPLRVIDEVMNWRSPISVFALSRNGMAAVVLESLANLGLQASSDIPMRNFRPRPACLLAAWIIPHAIAGTPLRMPEILCCHYSEICCMVLATQGCCH